MKKRYKIIDASVSNHCCFDYTVVDTAQPTMLGGKHYISERYGPAFETVCECFDEADAELVCAALNKMMV